MSIPVQLVDRALSMILRGLRATPNMHFVRVKIAIHLCTQIICTFSLQKLVLIRHTGTIF